MHGVQLQRPPIFSCPGIFRIGQVYDVRHSPGADNVVMAQQVAALCIAVAGAVSFFN